MLIEIVSSLPLRILKYQGKGLLLKTRFLLSCGLYNIYKCLVLPSCTFPKSKKGYPFFSVCQRKNDVCSYISLSCDHFSFIHYNSGMTKEVAHSSSTAGAYEIAFTLHCPDCQSRRQVGRHKRRVTR